MTEQELKRVELVTAAILRECPEGICKRPQSPNFIRFTGESFLRRDLPKGKIRCAVCLREYITADGQSVYREYR